MSFLQSFQPTVSVPTVSVAVANQTAVAVSIGGSALAVNQLDVHQLGLR